MLIIRIIGVLIMLLFAAVSIAIGLTASEHRGDWWTAILPLAFAAFCLFVAGLICAPAVK